MVQRNGLAALTALMGLTLCGLPLSAGAQDRPAFECDNRFGSCGTPNMSGGGGGGGGGGAILIANTDLGDTYQFADDYDNDGIEDPFDNCPRWHNVEQLDSDGDLFGDACDNCATVANPDQFNFDGDEFGNVCDIDLDGDGLENAVDNCAEIPNPVDSNGLQPNLDGDEFGDACDPDIDQDGILNLEDACPMNADISTPTAAQRELCFPDTDGDGVGDFDPLSPDICPNAFDPDQLDLDGDGLGDACDPDIDDDGLVNTLDNCAELANGDQLDADRDGRGDACDNTFCYVVFGDEDRCLDPTDSLSAYVPALLGNARESFRLPLFVNRDRQALTYTWTVVSAPAGSNAVVGNNEGSAADLVNYEVVYGAPVTFTPDQPGEYTLRVVVTTDGADNVTNEFEAQTEYLVTIFANGAAGSGCSVSSVGSAGGNAAGLFAALGVFAFAFIRRRRRRAA
ncbi:MAG: thrombospondin type 3 repeat-containing protein [Sandaracinaceae bacterium]